MKKKYGKIVALMLAAVLLLGGCGQAATTKEESTNGSETVAAGETEAVKENLRNRREVECFSVINRGQLWYEGVSIAQLLELRKWYKAWLNVTDTLVVPEKPTWLE